MLMLKGFVKFLGIAAVLGAAGVAAAQAVADVPELSLDEAIVLALERHADVRRAELELWIAQLELEAAWARSTVPSIGLQVNPPDLTAGGFAESIEGTLGVGVSLPWGTQASLSADLRLGWNRTTGEWDGPAWGIAYSQRLDLAQLDAGSREIAAREETMIDAEAAIRRARNSIVLETIEAYRDLLSAKAQLAQAGENLRQAEADLAQAEAQTEAGIKGEAFLLEAQLAVLDAQIASAQAETAYATDKEVFGRVTLGIGEAFEPVVFELRLDELSAAASALVAEEGLAATAILNAAEVQVAQRRVEDAEETLRAARADALPELSIEADIDEAGWKVGWGISFDLFDPDRFLGIDIAAANVDLAEAQLEAAQEQVRNSLLNQQTALRKALEDLERLPLEEEKWLLEEQIARAKREAGTISERDWEEFLEGKQAFDLAKEGRATSLLLAFLAYRDGLKLELEWEEWLR